MRTSRCWTLGAVEFKNAAESRLGVSLPVTVVFDYPTISALAGYIHSQLVPAAGAVSEPAELSTGASSSRMVLTIRSFGGNLPVGSVLSAGPLQADCVGLVPFSHWDVEAQYSAAARELSGRLISRFGAFLEDIDSYDNFAFSTPRSEAALMDPQQRLLLHVSWDVLSGLGPEVTPSLGVYVGISSSDFAVTLLGSDPSASINAYSATGSALSVASGRLSFTYGAQGPCASVDTACSSSAVSAHFGAGALRAGECRAAMAAGVNVILLLSTTATFSIAGSVSFSSRLRCESGWSLEHAYRPQRPGAAGRDAGRAA